MRNKTIYALIDPRNNHPFYIGSTMNLKPRFIRHLLAIDDGAKDNYINELRQLGIKPVLSEIDKVNFNEANFWESHYIWLYKSWGFKLVNANDASEIHKTHFNNDGYKKTAIKLSGKPHYHQSKKVYQYDKNNSLIKIWDSPADVGRFYVPHNHLRCVVRQVLCGYKKTYMGFKWTYTPIIDLGT